MEQLPENLRRSIVETLGSPVIPLFFGYTTGSELSVRYAGSGLLVEVDGESGIVTAEHVIFSENRLRNAEGLWTISRYYFIDNLADPLPDDPTHQPSATNIQTRLLDWYPPTPYRTDYEADDAEWGPDLGFIRIPRGTNFEGNLRATRNFVSLARDPSHSVQRSLSNDYGILAVVGAPGEWIEPARQPRPGEDSQRVTVGTLVTAQGEYSTRPNGYDYIDAKAAREPGLFIPESFQGVSGGALWLFRDFFHMSEPPQVLARDDYVLAGIAFWENQEDRNAPFIRSHGPRSIYENFLPRVREWLRTRTQIES